MDEFNEIVPARQDAIADRRLQNQIRTQYVARHRVCFRALDKLVVRDDVEVPNPPNATSFIEDG